MPSRTIYLVVESGYEHTTPIQAFTDEVEADLFIKALKAHAQLRPEYDEIDEAGYEQYKRAREEWEDSSPCEHYVYDTLEYDHLLIQEIKLYEELSDI